MTGSISAEGADGVRHPVFAERVICARLGSVEIDRCRECVYLLRIERSAGRPTHVVCAAQDCEPDLDLTW